VSEDVRQKGNRSIVITSLEKAAKALRNGALGQVDEALRLSEEMADEARRLANSSPYGRRALPRAIRRETEAVLKRIAQAQERIRAVPVTSTERKLKKASRR